MKPEAGKYHLFEKSFSKTKKNTIEKKSNKAVTIYKIEPSNFRFIIFTPLVQQNSDHGVLCFNTSMSMHVSVERMVYMRSYNTR